MHRHPVVRSSSVFVVALLALIGLLSASAGASAVTVVTPTAHQGWLIGPFPAMATIPFGFEAGPGTPPFGSGSFFTTVPTASEKVILARNDYYNLPLANLTAFSFWTYIEPTASNTNDWYVNLYFDVDGNGTYDNVRLDYVPPSAQVMTGVWQQWDAFTGTWNVNTGGTTTLADFLAANPNARFNAFSTPDGGAVRFNMGDTASSYVGFDGNLDGIRIAHTDVGDTTWDFETTPSPVTEIPTAGPIGLTFLALLLLAAGWAVMRR